MRRALKNTVCFIWGAQHRWVYDGGESPERYVCACGRKAHDVGEWAEKQTILEPDEEAELLGILPATESVCEHGTLDPDNPHDPCMPCAVPL